MTEELAASSLLPDESLLALLKSGEADMSVATEEATSKFPQGQTERALHLYAAI